MYTSPTNQSSSGTNIPFAPNPYISPPLPSAKRNLSAMPVPATYDTRYGVNHDYEPRVTRKERKRRSLKQRTRRRSPPGQPGPPNWVASGHPGQKNWKYDWPKDAPVATNALPVSASAHAPSASHSASIPPGAKVTTRLDFAHNGNVPPHIASSPSVHSVHSVHTPVHEYSRIHYDSNYAHYEHERYERELHDRERYDREMERERYERERYERERYERERYERERYERERFERERHEIERLERARSERERYDQNQQRYITNLRAESSQGAQAKPGHVRSGDMSRESSMFTPPTSPPDRVPAPPLSWGKTYRDFDYWIFYRLEDAKARLAAIARRRRQLSELAKQ